MITKRALPTVATLVALSLIAGTLLGDDTAPQRVGFAFEGAIDQIAANDPTKALFKKIIPNGSRVSGTFSYDTGSDFGPGPDGTRVFHQRIEGGFTINFDGGPLTISASDYTITVGNDYKPSNIPAAVDYLSVDYSGLQSSPQSPLIVDGAAVIKSTAVLKAAMTWDVSTWNDPDEPKLRSTLPVGPVLPFQSLAGPFLKQFTITSLSPIAAAEGDFNLDGKIDASDFVEWRKAFGQSTPDKSYADANHDSVVDGADYVLWRRALLQVGSGGFDHPAVPEPSCACLMGLVVLYLCSRRR